jgi:hypothetical protein
MELLARTPFLADANKATAIGYFNTYQLRWIVCQTWVLQGFSKGKVHHINAKSKRSTYRITDKFITSPLSQLKNPYPIWSIAYIRRSREMVYPLPIPCQRFHHKSQQRRILHALDRSVISQRNPSSHPPAHFFPLFLIP